MQSKYRNRQSSIQRFDHLLVINRQRNTMIHYGTLLDANGVRHATRGLRAVDKSDAKRMRISPRVLSWMEADVDVISLTLITIPFTARRQPFGSADALKMAEELCAGWRFTEALTTRLTESEAAQ